MRARASAQRVPFALQTHVVPIDVTHGLQGKSWSICILIVSCLLSVF